MHFKAKRGRANGMKMQKAFFDPTPQVDSDGHHIAHELVRGFLKREKHTFLSASAGGVDKMSGQAGFPRARRSRHENAVPPKVALAAEHLVQCWNACGHPIVAGHVCQVHRGHGQNRNAVALDQEWILIHPMGGAPVLHDA
jgi:hypothetical protein